MAESVPDRAKDPKRTSQSYTHPLGVVYSHEGCQECYNWEDIDREKAYDRAH